MKSVLRFCMTWIFLINLTACASSGSVKRPAYSGEDGVGSLDQAMIIGQWRGRILNPIEGEATADAPVMNYMADGQFVFDSRVDTGGMGVLELQITGTWQVDGEWVRQEATDIQERSGNALGALANLFKGRMLKNSNARLNVYEADNDRIVVVSDDGMAQEWTRMTP